MKKLSCFQCGETDQRAITLDANHVLHCATCGSSVNMEENLGDISAQGEHSNDVTMADVLEVVNANIEFSKQHQDLINLDYDDSDLPF